MRPSILGSFWRLHKGRQQVLGTLRPFVEHSRHRFGGIRWDEPGPLGFLVTLITCRAQQAVGTLAADALGDLQAAVWGRLTGMSPAAMGERIALLSACDDGLFLEGRRRALLFDAALAASVPAFGDADGETLSDPLMRQDDRDALFDQWDRLLADIAEA